MAEIKLNEDALSPTNFPSNSKTKKIHKQIQPVVKGKVTLKQKTLSDRLMDVFSWENVTDVFTNLYEDIIAPNIKDTLVDLIRNGAELMIYGDIRSGNSYKRNNQTRVSYGSYYKNERKEFTSRNRSRHDFGQIIFEDRRDAAEALDTMLSYIEEYGEVTVADFYDLADITPEFTDDTYGWENLRSARIVPVRGGYMLELPKPKPLRRR